MWRVAFSGENGTIPEGAIGYAVPGWYANFSATVTEPVAGDLTVMNVDTLEFQPLDASPVYAPADADAAEISGVSVRVSVMVLVEERVK